VNFFVNLVIFAQKLVAALAGVNMLSSEWCQSCCALVICGCWCCESQIFWMR